jgi:hypothetical protein
MQYVWLRLLATQWGLFLYRVEFKFLIINHQRFHELFSVLLCLDNIQNTFGNCSFVLNCDFRNF